MLELSAGVTGEGTSMDVRVTAEDVGTRTVVHVAGEIDVSSADRLRERVSALVAEQRTDLVIDLTEVTFMDSTGLGLLVGTLKRVRTAGGRLVLVVDSERLLKVFRLTGLVQVFTIRDTLAAALAS
ncbi:STAS domain-containing protein [Cellulomonas sp. B6]|jgi:anti-sigma B factor antagonist|uniref:STAS domain-containing protein n=1 Tax=Cellulomonas sp. B6 TaxID=1295626 RepID=UPI0035108C95